MAFEVVSHPQSEVGDQRHGEGDGASVTNSMTVLTEIFELKAPKKGHKLVSLDKEENTTLRLLTAHSIAFTYTAFHGLTAFLAPILSLLSPVK